MANVIALIGDNCNPNKAIKRMAGRYFIGCNSHRFHIAVKDTLHDMDSEVGMVRVLMIKLRTPIAAAKLRKFTRLCAQVKKVTRWSSAFFIMENGKVS